MPSFFLVWAFFPMFSLKQLAATTECLLNGPFSSCSSLVSKFKAQRISICLPANSSL